MTICTLWLFDVATVQIIMNLSSRNGMKWANFSTAALNKRRVYIYTYIHIYIYIYIYIYMYIYIYYTSPIKWIGCTNTTNVPGWLPWHFTTRHWKTQTCPCSAQLPHSASQWRCISPSRRAGSGDVRVREMGWSPLTLVTLLGCVK